MSKTISFTDFELEIVRNMWFLEDSRYETPSDMTEEELKKYENAFEKIGEKIF